MSIWEALQRGGMLFLFVFLVLAVLYLLVVVFSQVVKRIGGRGKTAPAPEVAAAASVAVVTPNPTGEWGGTLRLQDVDEQTAAVIMAIVSDRSGIPLSELVFKSIRRVEPAE